MNAGAILPDTFTIYNLFSVVKENFSGVMNG